MSIQGSFTHLTYPMYSKKFALIAFAALAISAHAATGIVELGTVHTNNNGPIDNNNAHTASVLLDHGQNKFGFSLSDVGAYGKSSAVLGLRAVTPIGSGTGFSLDTRVSFSDRDVVAPRHAYGTTGTWQLANSSVGLGAERITFRGGAYATMVKLEGAYTPVGSGVKFGADATHANDFLGTGSANRIGVDATTDLGKYAVMARYDQGRLPASFQQLRGIDFANSSSRVGLSARTWVTPAWGYELGARHVDHKVYSANEVHASMFWKI